MVCLYIYEYVENIMNTPCVQMAMHGPCHMFTQLYKLGETLASPLCQELQEFVIFFKHALLRKQ